MAGPNDVPQGSEDAMSDAGGPTPMPTIGAATVNAPQLNKDGTKLELEAKSISSVAQAWQICTTLEQNNRQRALRTASIQAIHDGEPPRSAASQAEKAKSWMSNASTGWLAGIVGRQAQRFVNAIISQLYLTYSRLPDSYADAKPKSDLMQAKFTRMVRSWPGYTETTNALAVETVLQGYTYGVFLDPYTPKPRMFKQDRLFLPEMALMHAHDLQFFCCKEDYRLDKFIDLFADKEEEAKGVGYDLENCMAAANMATMQDPREDATTTQYRKWEDMINEGTLGLSYSNTGERVVKVWLLFNREYDGKVSFWMIARDTGKKLRFSFKLFKKMEDVINMFSFEPGNGCIHSSKGLGRKLAALAIMKELFRNGLIDLARIRALLILQTDAKDKNKLAPQILAPFIYIDSNIKIPETQFTTDLEGAKLVDQIIDQWAEQAVGAYLATNVEEKEPEKTATQATIEAKREQEAADIQIRRWLDQYFGLTQIQQLRAFSDDNIDAAEGIAKKINEDASADKPEIYEGHDETDPEVLRTLVEILRSNLGITADEIRVWRSTPASVFAHVSDAIVQQGVLQLWNMFKGDPSFDQEKFKGKISEALVGAQDTSELLIPKADQTVVVEAERMQYEEASSIANNLFPIGVSPRDNHMIHGAVCVKLLTDIGKLLSVNPSPDQKVMTETGILYNHFAGHLEFAQKDSTINKTPDFQALEKFFEAFGEQLKQVIQIHAQADAAKKAVVAKIAGEGVPGAASTPGAAPAPIPPQGTSTPSPGAPVPLAAAA